MSIRLGSTAGVSVLLAIVLFPGIACAGDRAKSETETMRLRGCRIAIVIADGYHEHEFWFPYYRFKEEGAELIVAGPKKGTVYGEGRNGKDGLPATVTHTVEEIQNQRFSLVYLPGGLWSPMELRAHRPTLEFVRQAMNDNVLVAAICHAPWILISADVVRGRRIACPSDMAADVTNAGGKYVPDRCVQDGNLITAVYYGCLPEHFRVLMPELVARHRSRSDAK